MRLSYSVQSICGLIQQKQQTMFKFNFYLYLAESFTKSELKRSCSLDSLLMAKVCLLLQSHQFCSSGFQEALLGQRRPTTLVRQRLVAPPSNSLQRRICSRSRQLEWTNGRYRAALAAKKQIGKPGRSQISPNYTWPQAIIRLFPILCIYSTSCDVLMSYHDECQCGCESSKRIQSRQVINQQIAGRVRGTLLPQITNI